MAAEGPILYFDGVCNLCNSTVQFLIRNDKKEMLRFASLQSKKGLEAQQAAAKEGVVGDSVLFFYKGKFYNRSGAIIRVLAYLGGFWRLIVVTYVIPPLLRDALYSWIAKNRFRWFGKREECMLPTPELRQRFLDI